MPLNEPENVIQPLVTVVFPVGKKKGHIKNLYVFITEDEDRIRIHGDLPIEIVPSSNNCCEIRFSRDEKMDHNETTQA